MTILTHSEVRRAFRDAGVLSMDIQLADLLYALPARDFIEKEFAAALQKFYWQLRVNQWLPEKGDCDDFARGAAFFASLLHRRTHGAPDAGIAFGEFWYFSETLNGSHAINVAITKTDRLHLVFFEPQQFRVIPLTETEVQSCSGIRI